MTSMSSGTHVDCDVVIVGAGPVGLFTALLLERYGHRVQVYERHLQQYPQPRAVWLAHQAARAFSELHVLDQMLSSHALEKIHGRISDLVVYSTAEGEILGQVPIGGSESISGFDYGYCVHQPELEAVLERTCQQRGIFISRGMQVLDVVDTGSHVNVQIRRTRDDEAPTFTVRSWFVVGCDGAKSQVRASAGIRFIEHKPASTRWLVVDMKPLVPGGMKGWKDIDGSRQYLDPRRPRTSCPAQSQRRRWEFMVLPDESTELASSEEFVWQMVGMMNCTKDTAMIERSVVYSVAGGWAETFSKGRIALAGDAAHVAPQFLGQGINSGLRDAKSLAWRLDYTLRYPEMNWNILLRDYSNEQLGTTKIFVAAAKETEAILSVTDFEEAKIRDATVRERFKAPKRHGPDLERVAAPGMHLRQPSATYAQGLEPGTLFLHNKVNHKDRTEFLDNVVNGGWCLISKTCDASTMLAPDAYRKFELLLRGKAISFGKDGDFGDPSGRYLAWFESTKVEAVLMRPDYYIYGTVESRCKIEQLVRSALAHTSIVSEPVLRTSL